MRHAAFRKMMAQAFYGELHPEEKQRFDEHFAVCESCAEAYRQIDAALSMMHQRQRQEPEEAYWQNFWARFEPELRRNQAEARQRGSSWWKRPFAAKGSESKLAYSVAFAVLLIVMGVGIGRFLLQPDVATVQIPATDTFSQAGAMRIEQVKRTEKYLDRSRTLLLGIVNSDTSGAVNLTNQKRISRELVDEARVLQASLKEPDQVQLRKLVGDLELILMQIANLEARYDLPAIELVKSGVNRSAILLKINIEQMQMDSPAPQSKNIKPNS
ncbi:MAG: anti-sigma factor family protein [Bacteroidota bacterium]